MRTLLLIGTAFLAASAQAIAPLTVEACRAMKTAALRQQCLLSAVDAPPSVTGKTYSTRDTRPRGPIAYEVPAPASPVTPYLDMAPGSRPAGGLR